MTSVLVVSRMEDATFPERRRAIAADQCAGPFPSHKHAQHVVTYALAHCGNARCGTWVTEAKVMASCGFSQVKSVACKPRTLNQDLAWSQDRQSNRRSCFPDGGRRTVEVQAWEKSCAAGKSARSAAQGFSPFGRVCSALPRKLAEGHTHESNLNPGLL